MEGEPGSLPDVSTAQVGFQVHLDHVMLEGFVSHEVHPAGLHLLVRLHGVGFNGDPAVLAIGGNGREDDKLDVVELDSVDGRIGGLAAVHLGLDVLDVLLDLDHEADVHVGPWADSDELDACDVSLVHLYAVPGRDGSLDVHI